MTNLEQLIKQQAKENAERAIRITVEDISDLTYEQYTSFNRNAWKNGTGFLMEDNYFPIFNEKMEGLENGLFLLAGEPNGGKTALLQEIILRYAQRAENKLFGVYFSLDDTEEKIIPRLLAANSKLDGLEELGAPISVFSKPMRYLNKLTDTNMDLSSDEAKVLYSYLYEDITGADGSIVNEDIINAEEIPDIEQYPNSVRGKAFKWLNDTVPYFKIIDGTTIRNGEQLIEYCKQLKICIQEATGDPDYNLIVGIDSFSDIIWEDKKFNSDKEINDYTSKTLKSLAVEELKCPIFGTIHLRKIDQRRRPTISDVKESGRWAYEANIIFVLHNDVSKYGENAKIYGIEESEDFKLPVLEIAWAKNKNSSFKGRTYCYFKTNYSRVWECDKEAHRKFDALLYSL